MSEAVKSRTAPKDNLDKVGKDHATRGGAEYLQDVLGDVLAGALSSVARERPPDPIQFVANYLYKVRQEQLHADEGERQSEDEDSGHFEDQEAPSNKSSSTGSTLELGGRGWKSVKSSGAQARSVHSKHSQLTKGPSTSSSTEGAPYSRHHHHRRHHHTRQRSRRRRTAQSEPAHSVTSPASLTYNPKKRDESGPRSRSLTGPRIYEKNDPRRMYSKKVPIAALEGAEYRKRRGLRLPPMIDSPTVNSEIEDVNYDIKGKAKPKQLQPMDYMDRFDWQRHLKKNKKLMKENRIINNMI
ncbi:hypothetical protein TCAL_12959 [Tigriopus californicus]|uniref:RIIa domain-containing protein n=1 Tax=Tigriopus californicus TaxID=6832 RepID=A0A553P7G9_TIGCA|nr:uncharacterized protein LOC131878361 [Tigriopus californicus]TRY73631.1 hypothetical protein TCAL_12959 [Tigriopus californicus]|eukprot:TCALIF_12959-PA protein Name:"Protein of unknown function" AED:0.53 eAED:0.60 QI:0/-1/0/1/-1/1/1/0/297